MRSSTHVRSSLSLRHAVAAVLALSAASYQLMHTAAAQEAKADDVANLSDVNVADDPLRALSNEPSASSFGFAKPLLETPRTVTFVSEEQLRLFSVGTVEDLARLVPGVYTTTRYGLQGGINVRGVSADFYYRGMKRLNQQGHVRTVLSAYDNIEVIKGPPSPLYGLGKIGGYANLDPKSNRAKTGKYMTKEQGYVSATVGTYQKNEMQLGLGVPFSVYGKTAGAYIVALLEDSGTFVRTVKAKQKFVQATVSVDNMIGPFRLETGGQTQNSITSGAFFTRVTQNLIDNNKYVAGTPMANLDVNGDGRIGYVETYIASPIQGNISSTNQPLTQRYTLKQDANGNPLPLSSFANQVSGVPLSFQQYLGAHPELNCAAANAIRGATAIVPSSANAGLITNQIPVGFALNPCNTKVVTLNDADYRANGAYEREQNATQRMAYFDLIYDTDPNFTVKNQVFYDSISSFKDSWLPYGENQAIRAIEDKVTVTKRLPADLLPDWLAVNTLGSANYRKTSGFIRSSGGDFDFRQDITLSNSAGALGSGTGGFYPNTMFWTQLTNNSYYTGAVNTVDRYSSFSESGIGLMADIDIFKNTNLVVGGRIDSISVKVQELQGFNNIRGSITLEPGDLLGRTTNGQAAYIAGAKCATPAAGCPGNYLNPGPVTKDSQSGKSWSMSLSHKLPWFGLVPYVTKASTTLTLDGANNLYTASTLATFINDPATGGPVAVNQYANKAIGEAKLLEGGIKGQAFRGKVQWTLAGFKQERTDVSAPADLSSTAEVSSTLTKGVEASINFAPTKKLFMQAAATYLDAKYIVGASALAVDVNARDLGFQDILDGNGNVIYPAEAFLYGGRTAITLNDPNNIYSAVPGTPKWTGSLSSTYQITKKWGVLANAQYAGWSWGSRLQTLKIPAATTLNLGVTWDSARVHLKANVFNVTDDLQFRATNGTGNRNMASVLPDRRYEGSLKIDF